MHFLPLRFSLLRAWHITAVLRLTAAGTADGFTLSTFATTNPGNTQCCTGPFGVAVANNGNIIIIDRKRTFVRLR